MITKVEWQEWIDLVNSYTEYHNIRPLTDNDIVLAMLKHTVIAESLVTCKIDVKGFERRD